MVCVRMVNVRYICDERVVEDIVNFCCTVESLLVIRRRLLGMIEGIEWTEEWMAEWRNKGNGGRVG